MKTPDIVKEHAQDLIKQFGDRIEYVGKYQDCDVFQFKLPNNQENGFPIVYLYDSRSNKVEIIEGPSALKLLKNLD